MNSRTNRGTHRPTTLVTALLAGIAALMGSACAAGGPENYTLADIVDEAPAGVLGGATWSARSAIVRRHHDELYVSLLLVDVDACDTLRPRRRQLKFSVPRLEGEYPLNLDFAAIAESQTVTFVTAPGNNVVASEGLIVVERLDDDAVTFALVADAGQGNYVNGRVTATVCND